MKHLSAIALLILFFFTVGCSPSTSLRGLVPGEGIVTLDGVAVDGASLTFIPVEHTAESRPANGTSIADGSFVLTTLQPKDGIYPGEYTVLVHKIKAEIMSSAEYNAILASGGLPPRGPKEIDLLPMLYKTAEKTPLKVTISSKGEKELKIELKSK